MNGMVVVVVAAVVLAAGYLVYGRWLAKTWGIDREALTPAKRMEDGKNFSPASCFTAFSHQFSSICGAGPVTGTIAAMMFGWLPVLLWVLVGGIFFGAVHDFGALYASVKNNGKSLAQLIDKYIGRTGRRLFLLFSWLFTIIVIAAFVDMVAGTFQATFAADGAVDAAASYAGGTAGTISILFTFVRGKVKNVYQTLILLPYLMSWVIVSYVTYALFSGESGMLNAMITNAGGERVNFYGRDMQWLWPFVFIFFNTWKGTGFTFLFYYSAILAISPSLYDAAKLDGAGFWKQVRYVTVPGLKSTMVTMLIMGLAGIFRSDYGLFYLLSQNSGQLYEVSQTIDTFIFNALKGQGDLVTSSAAGILQSLVGLILVVTGNLVIKKIDPDSSLF